MYGRMRRVKKTERPPDDPFVTVRINIPRSIYDQMVEISDAIRQPVSRLLCYAAYNELECNPPFNFDTSIPDIPYVQDAYSKEAGAIYEFLKHFQAGTSLDTLILCKKEMGIEDKTKLLLGYRELLKADMIEEYYPRDTKFTYDKKTFKYAIVKGFHDMRKHRKVLPAKSNKFADQQKGPLHEFDNDKD